MLGEWVVHSGIYGEHASGLMVRRTLVELIDTIERSKRFFWKFGAEFHEQQKLWRFPNGARLRFAYLENDADAEGYQGHEYTRVYIEEIGNFPRPEPILKLIATLRSSHGVPCGLRATGNPGGPGHVWIRERYIDPAPLGYQLITEDFVNPFTDEKVTRQRVFIPSRLQDNPSLGADYVANLSMSGSPELVRAWLEGDWSVISGAFFPEFSMTKHVIAPFKIPEHWLKFRSGDWGSASPFSIGWYAVSDGVNTTIPRGALVKYREWYGADKKKHNVGLKLTAEQVGEGIKAKSGDEKYAYSVLDPAAFAEDGGPSLAERIAKAGATFRPADNKRVSGRGAMGGWDLLRSRLVGNEDGKPMIYFFATCADTIRTLPALPHDPDKPEDVDTEAEDHAPDEVRYACASRPYVRNAPKAAEARRDINKMTANEAFWSKRASNDNRL